MTKSSPFNCSVPLLRSFHWLPVNFRILSNISLLTYKTLCGKQAVYLHSMLAPSLPSHSLRSSKEITLSVPRVKTNTNARAFLSCALLFGTISYCLSIQPVQLQLSRNVSRHISLFGLFPLDTSMPDGLLILWNCFIDFAVAHRFRCHSTDPDLTL